MKPHKHAEIIKAWADGAKVEFRELDSDSWEVAETPTFFPRFQWRIKPERKPDVVRYGLLVLDVRDVAWTGYKTQQDNLALTFDGETGQLKSAEVLK